jgi:hypothetical protein
VQVKSNSERWEFGNEGSGPWILDYPAPLLFCVVNKRAAEFTVYHVLSRFQAAILSPMPSALTMLPGRPGTAGGLVANRALGSTGMGSWNLAPNPQVHDDRAAGG